MKRRDFLRITPAASLAFMINGLPVSTFAQHPLLELLAKQTQSTGRVIVLIQLNGGNDGLNMVIPIDQYSALSSARTNILIPQSKILSLSNTTVTGLHPAMTGIQNMFNGGLVNIVQGVSYPNPDFSHFRATDIWLTGSDSNQYLNTGWVGRYLDDAYPGYPTGYPNSTMPDPLAIQIGSGISTMTQGSNVSMGMSISNISSFYNIVNGTVDPAPATNAGHELTFIRYIAQQTNQYNVVIQAAAQKANNLSTKYPASGNSLADQLKIVARLIAGGLQTPVYIVSMGGFDTHSNQVDPNDFTLGNHTNLLKNLSDAVSAFYDDCNLLGIMERVAAMTFSEFGRRIISNASGGTDHGSGAPVMVFGTEVNPGFIGNNPTIPTNAGPNDNIAMQTDYRSIYAAILADWFQVSTQTLSNVLLQTFPISPVFKKAASTFENTVFGDDETLAQNYPNPFSRQTTIKFGTQGGDTSLQLFDATGRLVRTVFNTEYDRGIHEISFSREGLTAGIYFYRLTNGKNQSAKQMTVID
jgi:uncharacterized protein (DUF1501 family)